jgi:hypothetical protein
MPTLYIVTGDGDMHEEYYPTLQAADNASDMHDDEGNLVFFSWFDAMNALSRVRDHSPTYKQKLKDWVNNP